MFTSVIFTTYLQFITVMIIFVNSITNVTQNMNTRLQTFLNAESISQSQFADKIGVAKAGISHIMSGRNKPSYDFIVSTAKAFPALNLEWLITGEGKMYKERYAAAPAPQPAESEVLPDRVPDPKQKKDSQEDELFPDDYENTDNQCGTPLPPDSAKPTRKPQIVKILVFYDNGTYREVE